MELFFDTETSGMVRWDLPSDHPAQPWAVQVAALLSDEERVYGAMNFLVYPAGRIIPDEASAIHGWTTEHCQLAGVCEIVVGVAFTDLLLGAGVVVAHNIDFDLVMMRNLLARAKAQLGAARAGWEDDVLDSMPRACTMKASTDYCKLPGRRMGSYKWPKLCELHEKLFGVGFDGAHDALADIMATRRCYYELVRRGILVPPAPRERVLPA